MNRAYSLINVKKIDEGRRVFSGIASTPEVDRMNDTINPLGAKFRNPTVLLHQHLRDRPIGSVKFHKPTKDGIAFDAEIPVIDEPGALKDRVDTAWGEIKAGLVRAVSIGFKPIKYAFKEDGGIEFQEIEILELSTVSIPANAGAIVTSVGKGITATELAVVKQFDERAIAASGKTAAPSNQPPATGITINLKGTATMNIGAQIATLEAQRKGMASELEAIQKKVTEEGRTKNQEERQQFDTLRDELKVIDAEIDDLKAVEVLHATTAKPVDKGDGNGARPTVPATPIKKEAPGIRFARFAKVKAFARIQECTQTEAAEALYGKSSEPYAMIKAAVQPGTTASGNWASALVGEEGTAFADFAEFLRPMTILGRFGSDGIPALRTVPFRSPLISQTGGGRGYWVGEAKPKPLTAFDFARDTLDPLKVANICVLSEENIRDSNPSSEIIIRDALRDALVSMLDVSFIDPAEGGTPNIQPPSILSGAAAVVSQSFSDADDVRTDLRALFQKFINANNPPSQGVWIMSHTNALALSLLLNALGSREFPGMGMMGGTLEGLPVIASQHIGDVVALINASDVYIADEGGVAVDMSREASLEMVDGDAPGFTQNPPTGASLVSLWQNNLVALRAERTINWKRRRDSAAAYLTGVAWGGAVPES